QARLSGNRFWVEHGFTVCGKTHKCVPCRGRATLQGRVKRTESMRASAPVVAFPRRTDFFRILFSRAANSSQECGLSPLRLRTQRTALNMPVVTSHATANDRTNTEKTIQSGVSLLMLGKRCTNNSTAMTVAMSAFGRSLIRTMAYRTDGSSG